MRLFRPATSPATSTGMRWNVYRDTLTFSRVPGSDADCVLLVNPLTRVR